MHQCRHALANSTVKLLASLSLPRSQLGAPHPSEKWYVPSPSIRSAQNCPCNMWSKVWVGSGLGVMTSVSGGVPSQLKLCIVQSHTDLHSQLWAEASAIYQLIVPPLWRASIKILKKKRTSLTSTKSWEKIWLESVIISELPSLWKHSTPSSGRDASNFFFAWSPLARDWDPMMVRTVNPRPRDRTSLILREFEVQIWT